MKQELEFADRELALREATRAVELMNQSDEAKVESWFAMKAATDQVQEASNTGVRGITRAYDKARKKWFYAVQASCVTGRVATTTGSYVTEAEAIEHQPVAEKLLARLIQERGGRTGASKNPFPQGTTSVLIELLQAAPEGRKWVNAVSTASARITVMRMVRVAQVYGREGVNPRASLAAHYALISVADRSEAILKHQTADSARAYYAQMLGTDRTQRAKKRMEAPTTQASLLNTYARKLSENKAPQTNVDQYHTKEAAKAALLKLLAYFDDGNGGLEKILAEYFETADQTHKLPKMVAA